ncbi:unnamed protein product, partial [Allacma fusca]
FEPTDVVGSEDCLHVNVFAPKQLHDEIIQGKKPKQPYRLDILGFLTTGDKIARGNQGLKDQS